MLSLAAKFTARALRGAGIIAALTGAALLHAGYPSAATGLATSEPPPASDSPASTKLPPQPPYDPPENWRELLKIDAGMREFFAARIPKHGPDYDRLLAIVSAILQPDGLHFAYDIEATLDPREAFRRRRGNCVTFSMLFVAVARSFGFHVSFQNLDTTEHWDRFGRIVASVQHVNVRIDAWDGGYVVDLRPEMVPPGSADALREVTDERAFAQFYNTIGFFRLVHGDEPSALRYMQLATEVDPTCPGAWANTASMHARLGNLAAARTAFERALKLDPQGIIALDGFIAILRRTATSDDLKLADKLDRRARWIRDRNPYFQQHLAEMAQERGDLAEAEKKLRRAIALKNDEPEFYVQWIAVLEKLGRPEDVRRATAKLERLRQQLANASEHIMP